MGAVIDAAPLGELHVYDGALRWPLRTAERLHRELTSGETAKGVVVRAA